MFVWSKSMLWDVVTLTLKSLAQFARSTNTEARFYLEDLLTYGDYICICAILYHRSRADNPTTENALCVPVRGGLSRHRGNRVAPRAGDKLPCDGLIPSSSRGGLADSVSHSSSCE
jgi:hypothetical protein